MTKRISKHGPYGNPREQARRADLTDEDSVPWRPEGPQAWGWHGSDWMHGRSPAEVQQFHERLDSLAPQLANVALSGGGSFAPGRADKFFEGIMPPGATLAPGAGKQYQAAINKRKATSYSTIGGGWGDTGANYTGVGGGAEFMYQTQRPYQPEMDDPAKLSYPQHRNLMNIYARMFYKMDAYLGTGVDMIADMMWSDFELVGEGVDGEVKDIYKQMCAKTRLLSMLPYFVKEYLVLGEACPHLIYDDNKGIWTHIGLQNPDQLEVIYAPMFDMDPIVRFKPDNRLKQLLSSSSEMTQAVRASMPPELLTMLMGGQPVMLSPLNFTFIPRKMHPYDIRGTGIVSRLWRIYMLEDAAFSSTIAMLRRAAAPLKVAKLGDPATGWVPNPDQFTQFMELLAQAELDSQAWLCWYYGLSFEMAGAPERVQTIDKHLETVERYKLIALGINRALLVGETTYASAASGLTVFLQRLLWMREFFENAWIYPKFFKPVAEINGWVLPTQAESASASQAGPYIKTRRSHHEVLEDGRYIVPKIEWERQLDPSVESAQINAVQSLEQLGVMFSKQYKASLVNRDWEEELNQRAREAKIEAKIMAENPDLQHAMTPSEAEPGLGMDISPGLPPAALGFEDTTPPLEMGDVLVEEEMGEGLEGQTGDNGAPQGWMHPELWSDGRCGNWHQSVVRNLIEVIDGEQPEEELWARMLADDHVAPAIRNGDGGEIWDAIEEWLDSEGYPLSDIRTLQDVLTQENVFGAKER